MNKTLVFIAHTSNINVLFIARSDTCRQKQPSPVTSGCTRKTLFKSYKEYNKQKKKHASGIKFPNIK